MRTTGRLLAVLAAERFLAPGADLMLGFGRDASGGVERIHVASNLDER